MTNYDHLLSPENLRDVNREVHKVLIICFLIAIPISLLLMWAVIRHQNYIQNTPCSSFQYQNIGSVPARCVTPQGGFKG
jgi:hypothetical protein